MSGPSGLAKEAVEDYLQINKFIDANQKKIYEKLKKYDSIVGDKPESDFLFIAEGLPFINGIVQVGSTHKNFQEAIQWVRGTSEAGAVPVLTALTFIYIVEKKANDPSIPESEKKIWNRICRRVKKLSE